MMLTRILESWRGTAFRKGPAIKGVSAGCVGFVLCVLAELRAEPIPNLPFESEWDLPEDPRLVRECLRLARVRSTLPPWRPADVLLVSREGRPRSGHLFIVDSDPRAVWHVGVGGVSRVALAGICDARQQVVAAWRPDL